MVFPSDFLKTEDFCSMGLPNGRPMEQSANMAKTIQNLKTGAAAGHISRSGLRKRSTLKTLIFNGSPREKGDTVSLINLLLDRLEGESVVISAYRAGISPCMD